jgi:hypothetical protein
LEQTEIDALAQLRPGELRRIAIEAIAPFYDSTLNLRADEAQRAWQRQANEYLKDVVDREWLEQVRADLQWRVAEIEPQLRRLQRDLELDISELGLPPVPEVEPDLYGFAVTSGTPLEQRGRLDRRHPPARG